MVFGEANPIQATTTLPSVSVVTPSYNQGRFLEACMRSVLDQNYPHLEYMVVDGGSTDGSVDTIRSFGPRLAYWRSHADEGHMAALNEGFRRSTGEIMAWLNSDDMHLPWTLQVVADIFGRFPEVGWLTTLYPMLADEQGRAIGCRKTEGYNSSAFYRGRNTPLGRDFYSMVIQQEATFWRRSLWERAGGYVDSSLRVAGDFELWSRFFQHAALYSVAVPLACFRMQENSFTAREMDAYQQVCAGTLSRFGWERPARVELLARAWVRRLPPRLQRMSGLGFCAKVIRHEGRGRSWTIEDAWFV